MLMMALWVMESTLPGRALTARGLIRRLDRNGIGASGTELGEFVPVGVG
jgi:hypothetical protein